MNNTRMIQFKNWNKKYPNPLDLNQIVRDEFIEHGSYYIRLQAMKENSPIIGKIAFIGITIRKWNGDNNFDDVDYDERENILKEIEPIVRKIEKQTGILAYDYEH